MLLHALEVTVNPSLVKRSSSISSSKLNDLHRTGEDFVFFESTTCVDCHINLACHLAEEGLNELASKHYRRAYTLRPNEHGILIRDVRLRICVDQSCWKKEYNSY